MDTDSQSSGTSLDNDCAADLFLFSHEFPSDDVQELFRALHRHRKGRKFPLLNAFLSECDYIFAEEVTKLSVSAREGLLPFSSVTELALHFNELRKGKLGGAWEGAFLCIYQIGTLIGYFESQGLHYNLPSRNATVVGMSIGLFAAAATAASSSLADLAYNGAESVRVSFAFCAHVGRISNFLETRGLDEEPQSWAYVVTELSHQQVQEQLDQYNRETKTSTLNKVTISHADKNSVGVTGPPARLRHLFRHSEVLRYSKHSSLQIHGGLCHVPNIYKDHDVQSIINATNLEKWKGRPLFLPLLSPNTGEPFPAKDAAHLVELIIREALVKPLYFDNIVNGISAALSSPGLLTCEVSHFRTSIVSKSLLSSLDTNLSNLKINRRDLVDWMKNEHESPPKSVRESKLAVVGMSCRLPGGANDTELFWQLLVDGRDVHTTVPADRFDLEAHFDPTGQMENSTSTPFGNFIDDPGHFDPGFFNMSPREAEQTDPMQRLALVTAYEALEMAGFLPDRTISSNPKRVGTFYGQASDDYREVNANQVVSTYGIPGTERAFGNGRINYFFKFGGPSFNMDTACSSGLAAVHAACNSLWVCDTDLVIAGGLNIITNPDIYCMLTKGHFLSKTGQCKVWDENADGYCRSDGIGSVVIKRLDDAVADNDKILATIVAGATNHSCDAVSITHPHVENQKANYQQVMYQAGRSPLEVDYVELHGTGTQAGDAIESQSVLETFAPLSPQRRTDQRLNLGALKANMGHAEAGAGIASLIKVLLMYQKNQIPRHVGIKGQINPAVAKNLRNRNAGLVFETKPWPRVEAKKRYAIVNSFGAHGGNTTLLLEDAPIKADSDKSSATHLTSHVISISAKSKVSLRGNVEDTMATLSEMTSEENFLADLSYTLMARRMHHSHRITTSVSSIKQLQEYLENSLTSPDTVRPINASVHIDTVFAFTGQGAFYMGAGKQLYQHFPEFREQVLRLDRVVQQLGFPSVLSMIQDDAGDGREVSPVLSQLSILVLQIALTQFWQLLGVTPGIIIGHSLGEYAGFVAAGVLSAADAIYLVGKRAELLETICTPNSHRMLSVRASAAAIARIIVSKVKYEVACLNTPEETVISGTYEDINDIRTLLEGEGIKCLALDIPYAFHSSQMDPILDEYEGIATHVSFKTPSIPIVSPLLGQCVFDGRTINAKYLRRSTREPVNFVAALESSKAAGIIGEKTSWLEIGPHPVCGAFASKIVPNIKTFASLRKREENFSVIATTLAGLHGLGINIKWSEYYRPYEKCFNLVHLKHYHWNNSNHFIPYTGTWTLDKAHGSKSTISKTNLPSVSSLHTASVQKVVMEDIRESTGHLKAVTDIQRPDFLAAVRGHCINGQGVVTGSIWADMALTVGEHLYRQLNVGADKVHMNIASMEVSEAQIPSKDNTNQQLLQMEGDIDMTTQCTKVRWYTLNEDGERADHTFASAIVYYEDSKRWTTKWRKTAHLITDRIASLDALARAGLANRLSRSMVYQIFQNVVNYADRYRGMQFVVLNGLEAFANIELTPDRHGSWHTPPHWIDSIFQMAGFVMNGSDATETRDFFYITPGWDGLRMLRPFEAGVTYQSYVRMTPSEDEPNLFLGDIFAMLNGEVVGVCEGIKFRKIPRVLMTHMFSGQSQPSTAKKDTSKPGQIKSVSQPKPTTQVNRTKKALPSTPPEAKPAAPPPPPTPEILEEPAAEQDETSQVISDCLDLVARETGINRRELTPDASFNEMGIDSLMSLVLSEKLLRELNIEVKSSTFLDCPTVGEFTEWLSQYR